MNLNYTCLLLIILGIMFSCNSTDIRDKYKLESITVVASANVYDDNGKLKKVITETTTKYTSFPNQEASFGEECLYIYDHRGRLLRNECYTYDETGVDIKEMTSIEYLTDSTHEHIMFSEYPKDTLSYTFAKKDKRGNMFEEYNKRKVLELDDELSDKVYTMKYKYDDNNNCIWQEHKMPGADATIRNYIYESKNDTMFCKIFIGNFLDRSSKKYRLSENTELEVTEYLGEYKSIDSLYYKNGLAVKEIKYDAENNKRVTITEYDERGNETKTVFELWVLKSN